MFTQMVKMELQDTLIKKLMKNLQFISYSTQNVSFNNGEYKNSDNLSFGFRHELLYQDNKISFLPLIGISRNNIMMLKLKQIKQLKKIFIVSLPININTKKIKNLMMKTILQ